MTTGSQENTYRVYIDAMIPSYLVAPLSRDPKIAAWQRITDAIHVAVAAIHDTRYLATWNFTHLANASTRSKIERVCRYAGYSPPRIDTPEAILEAINV